MQDQRVIVNFRDWARLAEHPGLRHLHLGGNFPQGGGIPEEWANMARLYHLDLSSNGFAGVLPISFGYLRGVRHIEL